MNVNVLLVTSLVVMARPAMVSFSNIKYYVERVGNFSIKLVVIIGILIVMIQWICHVL